MNGNKHDEIEDSSCLEQSDNPIEEKDIYENGQISNIKTEELLNNKVAIKQLINTYNLTNRRLSELERINKNKEVEIGLLKSSGFMALPSTVINTISTILVGFAINFLTGVNSSKIGIPFLIIGIICGIVGNILPVLYPIYVKKMKEINQC